MGNRAISYFKMTQPVLWGVLVVTAILGFILGSLLTHSFYTFRLILVIIALASGTAGCESITNLIDLPADKVMNRTRHRPLVTREISAKTAIGIGTILLATALVLSFMLGLQFLGLMTFGIFDNIFIYSYWLKPRTYQNIIWGSFAGAIPVLFGFLAADSASLLVGFLLFMFVLFWTPPHIWSLAVKYTEDYKKAKIPMLPTVFKENVWGSAIAVSSIAAVILSFALIFELGLSLFPMLLMIALNIIFMYLLTVFLIKPKAAALSFFNFLNIYLIAVLTVLILNVIYF
jgi:protoheme IX farnesyltransferase